ncbi:hypothetical protein H4R34_000630 [Dimargaris verticillata]|uniref:Metallo-beta-lactamase domain-containing protein n=1 Tax=Dimargaris verticillata TaxID=2761393 RepID=A0A9W8B7R5_9FUNG|nr:hypothetical protein H4R34_000630 [Dimargaris verticillata]
MGRLPLTGIQLAWPSRHTTLTTLVLIAGGVCVTVFLDTLYIQYKRRRALARRAQYVDDRCIGSGTDAEQWTLDSKANAVVGHVLALYTDTDDRIPALPDASSIDATRTTAVTPWSSFRSQVRVTAPLTRVPLVPLHLRSMYVQGHFVNPFPSWRDKTLTDFVLWRLARSSGNGLPRDQGQLQASLPLVEPSWATLYPPTTSCPCTALASPRCSVTSDATTVGLGDQPHMTITWLGQSTCYVQLPGLNILTDPIFQNRTVTSWLGPKRLRPVPCQLDQLQMDIVLVSHNHYDHLDIQCVRELGNSVLWFVPAGLRTWFARIGVTRVVEMDWWQTCQLQVDAMSPGSCKVTHQYHVTATPAQHWSGRGLFDSNRSLWCGWFVRRVASNLASDATTFDHTHGPALSSTLVATTGDSEWTPADHDLGSFFHCGDTGYHAPIFRAIREYLGPVTLAALPIGSYQPRWYMCHQHTSPDDAVRIHQDLAAHRSLGVHWATFMLSDESYLTPPQDLRQALNDRHVPVDQFMTTHLGETVVIPIAL